MKVQEVISLCNSNEFYSLYDFEEKCNIESVARNLNIDSHRWYEESTTVYKCDDGFVGVTGVSQLYSESMGYCDCESPCWAKEYKPVQTITYEPVK